VASFSRLDLAVRRLERALPAVESVLSYASNLPSIRVKDLRSYFDGGTLADLETCSDLLVERRMSVPIDETDTEQSGSDADETRHRAVELADLISDSDIPREVAEVLLRSSEATIDTVDLFKITGPDGVRREYERLVGAVVTQPVVASEIAKRPSVVAKVVELSKAVVILGAALSQR